MLEIRLNHNARAYIAPGTRVGEYTGMTLEQASIFIENSDEFCMAVKQEDGSYTIYRVE